MSVRSTAEGRNLAREETRLTTVEFKEEHKQIEVHRVCENHPDRDLKHQSVWEHSTCHD